MDKLTEEEVSNLKSLQSEFEDLKTKLGDVEIHKDNLLARVRSVRSQFSEIEKALVSKYGKDATVNLDTGEIKRKE